MNREEARFILQSYGLDGQDGDDPAFREALEIAQHDPELARWFAEERAFDSRVGLKLHKSIKPPAHLRLQLLAQGKIVRQAVWWQRSPVRWAMAASLVILLTLAMLWLNFAQEPGFSEYRSAMSEFAEYKLDRLDLVTSDLAEIRRWLAQKKSHADLVLPGALNGRPSLGCRLVEWRGRKVVWVCFELENRQVAHLLVVDRTAFQGGPDESPVFNKTGELVTASWSHSDKAYLLIAKSSNPLDLMKFL